MGKKQKLTAFGFDIHVFCAKHNITKRYLAELAGIPYNSLLQISWGRRPGHEGVPAIKQAMREIEAQQCEQIG